MNQSILVKFCQNQKNGQNNDQMINELNVLRNKGFLLLTEKERKRYNELMNVIRRNEA